ncbi:putative disease resistance RPP13-like protein 1 [Triticum dicoccoides]|uniref:putative disease resistance RPP13-like protein 1 n=1 Tax=Triticum dicoccoides TaxID=85692 RepID=UPI000E7C1402|nr:putative disease resistance RPP13-like protein 1 [Triticum dicoccoides]
MAMVLETFISNFVDVITEIVAKEEFTLGAHLLELRTTLLQLNTLATGFDLWSSDYTVKAAISGVKDALYSATNMDHFQHEQRGSSMGTGCFIPYPYHLLVQRTIDLRSRRRIAQLNLTLKYIIVGLTSSLNQRAPRHVKSSSIVLSSDTVGVEVNPDMGEIFEIIYQDRGNIKIVSIVGAAGIGKSTLARKIFEDERTRGHFDTEIWLSVSGSFNNADLLKNILRSRGHEPSEYSQDISNLVSMLRREVRGRKIFLVLDDVWSSRVWNDLLRPVFTVCRPGSVVLVTTRNGDVAAAMEPTHVHRVDKMNPKDAWSLLMKKVAPGNTDEHQFDRVRELGMEIVKKCDSSPLAIKIVAEQLKKRNRTNSAWLDELNNQKWSEKGLPAELYESIYLSFDDLLPHLKQCFLYCCLFYEDEVIYYDKVIQMLMAEGFIPSDGSSNRPEALGLEYYRELVTRNLLEPCDGNFDQSHCAVIPSVLRSFAHHIARDEVLLVEDGKITSTPLSKFHRVSVSNKGAEYSDLQTHKSIRALLSFGNMVIKPGDSLSTLPLLRILHMNKTNVYTLVDSLRHLKLLKYLDLSNTDVSALPDYIGEMKCLQCICLQGCQDLTCLPRSIVNLERLRFLDLSGTQVMTVPRDFGRLVNLVLLKGFPAYTDTAKSWCTVQELGPLHQLMHLTIRGPENISANSSATCSMLAEKRHLRSLWLCCTSSDAYEQHSQEVYDELRPSPSLEDLTITGYFGRQLPVWLLSSDLENLRLLKLENLRSCTQLPCSFGQLPSLESLCIKHALSIRRIGEEFLDPTLTLESDSDEEINVMSHHFASMATSTIIFPKLRKLIFYGMRHWKEWDWDVQWEAMHALESLHITGCRLSHLPPGLAAQTMALRVITIERSKDLLSIDNFSSVVELCLHSNSSLEKIANLPNLEKLRVSNCPKLKVLEAVKALSSIELKDHEMRTLPGYLQDLELSRLQIDCNLKLLYFISLKDTALEWDNVSHIEHVEAYADGYEQNKRFVFNKEQYINIKMIPNTSSLCDNTMSGDKQNKRCSVLYTKETGSFVTYMSDCSNFAVDESESSSEQQE